MALTKEILKANAALSALTDEQLENIVTLSANDENAVIAKKTGEIYGGLDADILAASGIGKNGTEKTFDYAKRVIGEIKGKADGADKLNSQIAELTKEKAKLEKAIAEGTSDAETAKQLKQATADLKAVTNQYNELKTKYDTAQGEFEKRLFTMQIDGELKNATNGIKFKGSIPESATKVLLQQAIDKVKGLNPAYEDNGQGGKVLVFKDASGAIMRNPEKQLNPYSAADLLTKELNAMGIVDNGRVQQGAGTTPFSAQGGNGGSVDVSGAKTQNEAYDIIANGLMAQGLTVGSKKFDEAMSQAWKDNNVAQLPLQ
jgi:hypothetical protein